MSRSPASSAPSYWEEFIFFSGGAASNGRKSTQPKKVKSGIAFAVPLFVPFPFLIEISADRFFIPRPHLRRNFPPP
jgi:hypothetical protein